MCRELASSKPWGRTAMWGHLGSGQCYLLSIARDRHWGMKGPEVPLLQPRSSPRLLAWCGHLRQQQGGNATRWGCSGACQVDC